MEWVEGKVVDNIHWSENLFSLRITAEVDPFTAGQFTSLALDIDGERIARPYSYLNAPGQQPLEFFFYTATGGVLSNALVNLSVGDSVFVRRQSNGFFTLDEVPDTNDLWMLATGTGIAPFLSMLCTSEPWQRFQRVVLVHAVRTRLDLQYQDSIAALLAAHPQQFRFQAFVSRESAAGSLPGRIPAALTDGSLEQSLELTLNPATSHLMLCGNPDMVKDAVEVLKQRGFRKNRRRTPGHITVENYW